MATLATFTQGKDNYNVQCWHNALELNKPQNETERHYCTNDTCVLVYVCVCVCGGGVSHGKTSRVETEAEQFKC